MRPVLPVLVMVLLAGCGGPAPIEPMEDDGAGALVLRGVGHYRDTIGYLHLVGEVENRGADALAVQVEARLLDAAGADAGTTFTYACLPLVPAGGRSGFRVDVQDKDAAVADWVLSPVPGASGAVLELPVTGTARLDSLGHERVAGTVTNPGPGAAVGVKVCATFLLEDGTVGDVASAATDPRDLGPGATAAFEARALRDAAPFAERRLAAQGADA
ncbi:MAG: hypothetical protein QOD77_598 [Thermoplasmata archaeon]|jgi:hypothetical protein|nr:hypothetical protein [Thermoplasmata archaeon]